MAGLELLFQSVASELSCPQDALLCLLHWSLVTHNYRCLGAGEKSSTNEKKSEKLPTGWNADKDVYTLRYKTKDDSRELLLKAILMDDSLILNVMDPKSRKVADLTLKVTEYVNPEHLDDFDRVYKNTDELRAQVVHHIISPFEATKEQVSAKEPIREKNPSPPNPPDHDPLWVSPRRPHSSQQPNWPNPLGPFAVGGEDLDPFGRRGGGGMIFDPLRSGFPNPIIDPSAGLPNRLPPGAVPPGARFDPFGPPGANRTGPNPDHLPPPDYDNMFM